MKDLLLCLRCVHERHQDSFQWGGAQFSANIFFFSFLHKSLIPRHYYANFHIFTTKLGTFTANEIPGWTSGTVMYCILLDIRCISGRNICALSFYNFITFAIMSKVNQYFGGHSAAELIKISVIRGIFCLDV